MRENRHPKVKRGLELRWLGVYPHLLSNQLS